MYMLAKHLHVTAVALSIVLFMLRFLWSRANPAALEKKWLKILPHIVNTVLLLSAIWVITTFEVFPLSHAWLAVKLLGLVGYVVLGLAAFKWAKTGAGQWAAFIGALAVLGFTASVAYSKVVPFLH
ncbi:SirB2 family protein [Alteromonas sp. CYL-A6]|uniref:SirB2 family protein n=1 Tax=Alteromonas nitratireducens TaxID=3390813 RepID=UPI0034AED5DC